MKKTYVERTIKGTRWEGSLDGGATWHRGVPVSFTAENAQKCFDGQKTQTRRLMRRQPSCITLKGFPVFEGEEIKPSLRVGDIFYIREPWRTDVLLDKVKPTSLDGGEPIWFSGEPQEKHQMFRLGKLRPAMFLQRRFARPARYQVTEVRFERVNEISKEDALAEGISTSEPAQYCDGGILKNSFAIRTTHGVVSAFADLWNSIHDTPGTRFEFGPWVWAYTFRRVL